MHGACKTSFLAGASTFQAASNNMRGTPFQVPQRSLGTSEIERLVRERNERGEKDSEQYTLKHPLWNDYDVKTVEVTHREPTSFLDKFAYRMIKVSIKKKKTLLFFVVFFRTTRLTTGFL